MVSVNGEPLFHSVVLLLVLRCIHVDHHIGESVLRDNSKVTFHRPPCFGGKGTVKICQTAYYELKRISSTRRYLTEDAAKQLVTSCVLSRLDYCNSLLMGTPNSVIQPMQKVQNTAAILILRVPRHQNCTPLLQQLHWLPISEWIKYKTACMCYNAITGSAPTVSSVGGTVGGDLPMSSQNRHY